MRVIGSSGVAKVAGERKPTGLLIRLGTERVASPPRPARDLPETPPFPMIPFMDLQHTVRCLVRGVPHIFLGGVPAERAGDDRLALRKLGLTPTGRPALYSDAFTEGAQVPAVHTADGEGTPPPLRWDSPPPAARSLALLVEALTGGLAGHGRADPPEGWTGTTFVQVFDPDAFGGLDAFRRQMDAVAAAARGAKPRPGVDRIRLPGERGLACYRDQIAHGVALYPAILPALAAWAQKYDVEAPKALT